MVLSRSGVAALNCNYNEGNNFNHGWSFLYNVPLSAWYQAVHTHSKEAVQAP
jgi:hypothetical protein